MLSTSKDVALRAKLLPPPCGKLLFCENKMERRRIAFGSHAGPFTQRVQTYVDILGALPPFLTAGRENKKFIAIQSDVFLRRFDKNAVPVRVVSAVDLRAMQLRSADKGLDQGGRIGKAILRKIGLGLVHSEDAVLIGLLGQADAAGHDTCDVKVGSEYDEIGIRAHSDNPFFSGHAKATGRENRGHANRVNERHTEFDNVAKRVIESQSAARQLSFGVANHAIFYNHINIPQAKIAVAHSGCGSSVAHEQDGVETLGSEQDLNRGPGDMNSVRNNFRGYVGVGKYRADHSGIAVGKWAAR